ncbi:MAG: PAS domain-containing protein, partial [Gordonia sp. (in: high G+C Gram-positive bacteria)]|nr:PAS domain-containing protein [Gordonia sp. (in: high G+C Gram-positive bacteria)]
MASPGSGRADGAAHDRADARVGRFRYWFDADRWEWSDEVAVMHGYRPGDVTPTTELMMSHKHPADRESFAQLVQRMRLTKAPFSSRHRIVAVGGRVRSVIVIGRTFAEAGSVAGTDGFYLDVDDVVDESVRGRVADHVQHFRENGAVIEQAKGMLMIV